MLSENWEHNEIIADIPRHYYHINIYIGIQEWVLTFKGFDRRIWLHGFAIHCI